jgi:hypothetical protein
MSSKENEKYVSVANRIYAKLALEKRGYALPQVQGYLDGYRSQIALHTNKPDDEPNEEELKWLEELLCWEYLCKSSPPCSTSNPNTSQSRTKSALFPANVPTTQSSKRKSPQDTFFFVKPVLSKVNQAKILVVHMFGWLAVMQKGVTKSF